MGATPTYSLPYPELDEPDDVPTDMHELATAVEALPPLAFFSKVGTGWIQSDNLLTLRQAAGASYALGTRIVGEGGIRWAAYGDGHLGWGDGTGAPNDTNFYRLQAGWLKTDGGFWTSGEHVVAGPQLSLVGAGRIVFGGAADTTLYRVAANHLHTDGVFSAGSGALIYGDTLVDAGGTGAHIFFGPGYDTNLYRSSADNLKTDDTFWAGQVVANASVYVDYGNATGRLYFGGATDTSLYRAGANALKTDGGFTVGAWLNLDPTSGGFGVLFGATNQLQVTRAPASGRLQIHDLGGSPGIAFGNAGDTNLYRSAAQQLKTDGTINVAGHLVVDANATGASRLYFGNVGDASFYRSGASALKTDATFNAGSVQIGGSGIGVAGDTSLYRVAAGYWKTDASLIVGGKFRYGSWVEAANPGAGLVCRVPVYDVNETRTGYLHIYDS